MFRSLTAVLVFVLCASATTAAEQPRTISVTGTGSHAAAPDMAQVRLGVEVRARDARFALAASSDAMASILATLAEAGIEPRDAQTSGLSLHPEYDHSAKTRPIIGYRAANMLSVRIRDIEKTGEVLDALSLAGANNIQSVSFAIAEPQALQDIARRGAVADARRKAELYAEEAGVTLGPLISLSEHGTRAPQPQMMEMARASMDAGVPIAEGEMTLRASISAVYEIMD